LGAVVLVLGGFDGTLAREVAGGAFGVVATGSDGELALAVGFFGAGLAGGRVARDTGWWRRATGTAFADLCWAPEPGCCAGVAFAMAAVTPPVAITAPAATPFVTSESRRSARSRW
jgi:hypothetical protein